MKKPFLFLLALTLVACGSTQAQPSAQIEPTAVASSTVAPSPEATQLSYEPVLYRDPSGRYELSYPVGWMVDGSQGGSRGGYLQITSWQHEAGGFSEIPEGGSVIQIAIYQWDPVGDHIARLNMRRENFLSSGTVILEEAEVVFANGQAGTLLLLETTDGQRSVVLLTVLGSEYLEISGNGDNIDLLEEILSTFEFTQ